MREDLAVDFHSDLATLIRRLSQQKSSENDLRSSQLGALLHQATESALRLLESERVATPGTQANHHPRRKHLSQRNPFPLR